MTEAKHTAGPWLLDDTRFHAPTLAIGGYHTIDAGDRCTCPEKGYVGFSIAGYMPDADARLIAAAPDLLAALQNARSMVRAFTGDLLNVPKSQVDAGYVDAVAWTAQQQIEAALTKAGGV